MEEGLFDDDAYAQLEAAQIRARSEPPDFPTLSVFIRFVERITLMHKRHVDPGDVYRSKTWMMSTPEARTKITCRREPDGRLFQARAPIQGRGGVGADSGDVTAARKEFGTAAGRGQRLRTA